ncbi:MAG: universal stress protein [Desulfobacterales bacterium]|nr:universal stress protein [Desulfobacterales bacterium]
MHHFRTSFPYINPHKDIQIKILVGYDGSNGAKNALKLAQKLANAFNAIIYIVCRKRILE